MPDFSCVDCGTTFSLADEILVKYPRWTPKYCRKCQPKHRAKGKSIGMSYAQGRGGRSRSAGSKSATKEENLPVAEVLARYTSGPDTGVFTDGACSPNPGPGGWGVVHVENGEILAQKHGHDFDTTNNRMEMTAMIEGLSLLPEDSTATVYSDSKLCIQTLDEWAAGWARNGWKRKSGPIKNLDLVQTAYALRLKRPRVKLQHISAHAGHRWNEYADSLATAYSRKQL